MRTQFVPAQKTVSYTENKLPAVFIDIGAAGLR